MHAPTPWDLRLGARTVALSAVAIFALVVIERISTERGVAPGATGSIGVLPLVPIAAAIAAVIAIVPSASSGELRALASLGWSPWRARAGALSVATFIALFSAAGLSFGAGDVGALFPAPTTSSDVRVVQTPDGPSFTSARRGVVVGPDDVLVRAAPPSSPPPPPHGLRLAAALAVALAGVALTLFGAAPVRRKLPFTIVALTLWGAAEVFAFQAAGAAAASPFVTPLPSLLLIAAVAIEQRRARALVREARWL